MSTSRVTGETCLHPKIARQSGVDDDDSLHEECTDCSAVWNLGRVSPERAAAVRRDVEWELHVRRVMNGEE